MEKDLNKSVPLLNVLLANHYTLLLKVWQFHWNVIGDSFGSYHEALKTLYEDQVERVDNTAERIRALHGRPIGSMEGMLTHTFITEQSDDISIPQGVEMWEVITRDFNVIIEAIRHIHKQISPDDLATSNFLEDMIEQMEKQVWMIRSYTEK